ncbi:DUF917 family protein [Proteiniclasticum sp. SCR006]|uniref:DUF917 family protein n=1 Tax=Proteiniclasticum aestuarii TaxID=2817862 RepID=A0A939H6H3_9CLOT|nr:DUF917 family protein [Proteiniclasticum aestuarii]MBO1265142.1 DUF917 family protein [Proteiniclasticum aestuarii]
MKLNKENIEALALGGLILGAGGGGSSEMGKATGLESLTYGEPIMMKASELNEDDIVVTISGVGSPASTQAYVENEYYNRILEELTKELGKRPAALIPSEMGGASSFGPFIASAINGIPILDAACNGRAHPLGTMGSMGLHEKRGYQTIQVAMGGDPTKDRFIRMTASGSVGNTASLVLSAAIRAGGLVAVARNPVPASYVKEHAAIGCYSQSLSIGKAFLSGRTPDEKIGKVLEVLNGRIIRAGKILGYTLETRSGLDVGWFTMEGETELKVWFWNEYMAIEEDGKRIHTFPDFMMTFEKEEGTPLTTANIRDGIEVVLVAADRKNLLLGAGMHEASGYRAVEEALGIPVLPYVRDLIQDANEDTRRKIHVNEADT